MMTTRNVTEGCCAWAISRHNGDFLRVESWIEQLHAPDRDAGGLEIIMFKVLQRCEEATRQEGDGPGYLN